MSLDEETVREVVVSVIAVAIFITLILIIGVTYGSSLGPTGGLALVGSIVAFILVMAGVGFVLSR